MADITAFSEGTLGATVSPDELYENSLYKPSIGADANNTLEALNGLMDEANYSGSKNITAASIQPGAFVRGEYDGSDMWEMHSAQQTGNNSAQDEQWIGHGVLSKRFFIPWDKAVVLYGYQAWFTHTAAQWWPEASTWYNEEWFVRLYVDGVVDQSQVAVLPATSIPHLKEVGGYDSASSAEDYDNTARVAGPGDEVAGRSYPGIGQADRWRFVNKSGLLSVSGKGYHKIEVKMWPDCLAPDAEKMRCITRSSGIYVLAFRAGTDLITGS